MYNGTKRGLGLAGAIIGICLGAIEIIAGLIAFVYIMDLMGAYGGYASEFTILIIASLGDIAIGVVMTIMGAKLCRHPKQLANGVWETRTASKVTLIVFMSLMVVLYLISGFNTLRIVMSLVAITGLVLLIVEMCLKPVIGVVSHSQYNNSYAPQQPTPSINPGVEGKINELKRLKSLGVITEEQYSMAIDKIIKDAIM